MEWRATREGRRLVQGARERARPSSCPFRPPASPPDGRLLRLWNARPGEWGPGLDGRFLREKGSPVREDGRLLRESGSPVWKDGRLMVRYVWCRAPTSSFRTQSFPCYSQELFYLDMRALKRCVWKSRCLPGEWEPGLGGGTWDKKKGGGEEARQSHVVFPDTA